ncbi:MAG: hypothetical protein GVY06_08445 [Alphaproteobacteria bacterium]|nr:hypothetical protein [Alphaproteobacteria bacterium]
MGLAQQQLYISNAQMIAVVNAINSAVVAGSFAFSQHATFLFTWLFLNLVNSLIAARLHRRAQERDEPKQISGKFLRKAEFNSLVAGILWGMPVLVIYEPGSYLGVFFVLVACGTAAGFSSMMSSLPRVAARFLFGCSAPIILQAFLSGGPYALPIAVLGTVLQFALVKGSLISFNQLLGVIRSRAAANDARQQLLLAIEAIHDGFAIYGPDGDLQMSNSRFRQWFPNEQMIENDGDDKIRQIGQGRWVKRSVVPVSDGRRVSIHTDVTDLKNRERELIAARREAEEANAAKGRFLSTMSQELRTPLDIINGFSRLMKGDSQLRLSPEEIADYAGSIHAAGEHLLTVVNDIIEFSKVGAERYLHDPVEVDLRDLLANAVSLSAGFQRLTSLEGIDVSVSSRIGSIVVDEMAFRRVLMNLVTNAIQHGGEPVNISIRAFLRADGAPVVTIRDFGRGLPGSELERVFEPFYQSQPQRAGEFSGTGLGLTLSRELARLHGGDVHLSSREGAGTTASIVLPASAHIPPELAEPAPVSGDALGQGEAA